MATAQKQYWALLALDYAVDTSTPAGEEMAHLLATFGQFERRLIAQRMKEALADKKAGGVRLGRPPAVPQSVARRIKRLRARGLSLRAIADELNESGVPTGQGGKRW
jgi:DNA invertase Pin-like site-specific DNA recombinase